MRVTFAPGTTTQSLALTTLEDSISEQLETLTATLSSPVGASLATDPTATITIRDDDGNYLLEWVEDHFQNNVIIVLSLQFIHEASYMFNCCM